MERRFAVREQLAGVVRSGLGGDLRIADVTRLQGGSKKGVYRLSLDNGSSVIAYIWDATENYWPDHQADDLEDRASPFSPASGLDLFEAAHRRLGTLGIRTPQIYWTDAGKEHYPADVALVEDVDGGTLETLLHHDSESAKSVLTRLAEALRTMRRQRGASLGKVAFVDHGGISEGRSCEQVVLDRALDDLAEAASRDTRLAAARNRLEDTARELAAAVQPRSEYGLIHGELGPDHVLVDGCGHPVLIDIEGLMYFDVEWEHAFLRIRFGEHYRHLHTTGLDEQRLIFYTLAMHLSLVAGPLRLLDGDFPDRAFMRDIAEHHLRQALDHPRWGVGKNSAARGQTVDHVQAD